MKSKGHWKPSSFNFVFILHVKDVGDVALNITTSILKQVIIVGEFFLASWSKWLSQVSSF